MCFPKSASTFFAYAVGAATGRRVVPAVPFFGRREQEFDTFATLALRNRSVVLQSHTRYSAATDQLLQEVGTSPVLIVRDLFDCLMSLWDHMCKEGPDVPVALVEDRDLLRDDESMLDFLTDVAAPWYIQFYAGWMRAAASNAVDLLVLSYEHITEDTARAIELVCRHVGEPFGLAAASLARVEEVARAKPRFNQGVRGRGARFGPERMARVARLAAYYADVDFSPIGVRSESSTATL